MLRPHPTSNVNLRLGISSTVVKQLLQTRHFPVEIHALRLCKFEVTWLDRWQGGHWIH